MFASFSVLIAGGLVFVAFSEDVVLPPSLEVDVDDSTDVEPPEDSIDPELPEFPVEAEPVVAVVPPAGASALAVALDEVPPLLAEAPAELPPELTPADAPPPAELAPPEAEAPPSAEPERATAGAGRERQISAPSRPSGPTNRCALPCDSQLAWFMPLPLGKLTMRDERALKPFCTICCGERRTPYRADREVIFEVASLCHVS